jgi:hypothetical protein
VRSHRRNADVIIDASSKAKPFITVRNIMSATVLVMLVSAAIVISVALHGRGRWY